MRMREDDVIKMLRSPNPAASGYYTQAKYLVLAWYLAKDLAVTPVEYGYEFTEQYARGYRPTANDAIQTLMGKHCLIDSRLTLEFVRRLTQYRAFLHKYLVDYIEPYQNPVKVRELMNTVFGREVTDEEHRRLTELVVWGDWNAKETPVETNKDTFEAAVSGTLIDRIFRDRDAFREAVGQAGLTRADTQHYLDAGQQLIWRMHRQVEFGITLDVERPMSEEDLAHCWSVIGTRSAIPPEVIQYALGLYHQYAIPHDQAMHEQYRADPSMARIA